MARWGLLAAGAVVLAGCGAISGDSQAQDGRPAQPQPISSDDRQTGAQAHPQLLQEFGGAYDGRQAAYVRTVGQKIAFQSGIADNPDDFTVTLLNSPVNNAFAIPGGYVYVTRQLLGLMNDEAELASVLGHEVGHVAARHGQRRQQAATRNTIIGLLGQVLTGAVLGDSAIGGLLQRGIGTGAQLLTLRYSRAQEYEADDLGIRYLAGAGYDPVAASTMLAALARQTALDAQSQGRDNRILPEWASTHPDPAGRVARARREAARYSVATPVRKRDVFLTAIDGVLYGDDPAQGVINGNRFLHPDLRLGFAAPQGYAMANGTTAVTVTGSAGQAQFGGAGDAPGGLTAYVNQAFATLAGQGNRLPLSEVRRTTVNGLPAAYASARASSRSGQVDVTVFAYDFPGNMTYHFITLTRAGGGIGPFGSMIDSVRQLTPAEAAAIRPRRLQVVTVRAGDTVHRLAERMAYDTLKLQRFLTLNGLDAQSTLQPGQRVKIVTY